MLDFLGNLVSGAINWFNADENREAQERANAQNIAFQTEANRINDARARELNAINNAQQAKYADLNLAQQRDFAQQGIRWKVDDARAAGLHPLAALGAQVSSFSPISVGSSSLIAEHKAPSVSAETRDLGSFGQDISRAISAGSTAPERLSKMQTLVHEIATGQALEKGALENELLRTSIAKTRSQIGPPIPIPRPGPTRTVSGHAVGDDEIKQKAEDFPQTGIVRPFGYPLKTNPFFSDGQQFEDRYGDSEVGSTIKFGVNTLADHIYTGYGLWNDARTYLRNARARRQFNDRFHFR